jgi:hypothetical protein
MLSTFHSQLQGYCSRYPALKMRRYCRQLRLAREHDRLVHRYLKRTVIEGGSILQADVLDWPALGGQEIVPLDLEAGPDWLIMNAGTTVDTWFGDLFGHPTRTCGPSSRYAFRRRCRPAGDPAMNRNGSLRIDGCPAGALIRKIDGSTAHAGPDNDKVAVFSRRPPSGPTRSGDL